MHAVYIGHILCTCMCIKVINTLYYPARICCISHEQLANLPSVHLSPSWSCLAVFQLFFTYSYIVLCSGLCCMLSCDCMLVILCILLVYLWMQLCMLWDSVCVAIGWIIRLVCLWASSRCCLMTPQFVCKSLVIYWHIQRLPKHRKNLFIVASGYKQPQYELVS